ncbi:hypothetical protein ACSSS7_008062 [Eimeria intestinalis]
MAAPPVAPAAVVLEAPSKTASAPMMMAAPPVAPAAVVLEAPSKTASAPMMMAAPPVAPATVVLEAPASKGRLLAAADEEAETYEETEDGRAAERGLGKKKRVYVAEPVKKAPIIEYAPPPIMMAAPTKKAPPPPVMMAAPTKAPPVMMAAPSKKGRYLEAMEMIEI